MKTLEEIKDEVAKEHGYTSYMDVFEFTYVLCDEVAKRYAISSCEDLRERVNKYGKHQHNRGVLLEKGFSNMGFVEFEKWEYKPNKSEP